MKRTINFHDFTEAFREMGRENQFTYEGLRVLFESLEAYEEATAETVELDVIALCCEYAEETLEQINQNYGMDFGGLDEAEAWIDRKSVVCGRTAGTIVYLQF